jgi:hypothetical protein
MLSLHSNARTTRKVNDFDNEHCLIRGTRRHLLTQLSAADVNKCTDCVQCSVNVMHAIFFRSKKVKQIVI